jgi:hypothetical protein
MQYQLQRARGTVARRDQIIEMVLSRHKFSESYFTGIRNRLPRLYDLWRGVYTGKYHPHKNNIHIPLIFQMVWADAARKVSTSLNSYPLVYFAGYGPDDSKIARKREALFNAQAKDAEMFMKEVETFVTADLYGVAISAVMWDHREEERMIEKVSTLPLSGTRVRQIRKGMQTTFDGPNYEPVDRLDFFPQPNVKPRNITWAIRRYFLDVDDLRFLVSQGIFDGDEVDRLVTEDGAGYTMQATDDALMRRFQVRTGMTDEAARWMDKYTRPVEILEFWGKVPSEFADDGVMKRVITVANRRYLMRNRPNPFWHGRLPFIFYSPTPDPHYFDAPGKADIAEKLQIAANRYVNQGLDVADLTIDPMLMYDRNKFINTRNMYARPGKMIGVDGNPRDVLAPVEYNLQGFALSLQNVSQMRNFVEMGTGIVEDAIAGQQGPDRETARAFIGRREAAGTRLMLESRIYEENYLEPLANMFIALDKQFLETPREVMILGDNAMIDPITGDPIDLTREHLSDTDMVPNYAARAIGATVSLSKAVQQQNLFQLLQMVGVAPQIMGSINMVNFMRTVMRAMEIPNVNEIIQQQQVMGPALAAAGGNAQQVPTSGQLAQGAIPAPLQAQMGGQQATGLANSMQGALQPA